VCTQKKEYGFVQINGATVEEHPSEKHSGRMLQIRMTHPCVWIWYHAPSARTLTLAGWLRREWREEKTNTPIAFVVEFPVRPLRSMLPCLCPVAQQCTQTLRKLPG
jgi:hypothetical protein